MSDVEGLPDSARQESRKQSMLRIERVSKLYRASTFGGALTPALRKVSFDIERGEVVTLIGESGSGKTTLGKIVLRLESASSGSVLFEGDDISAVRRARLRDYYRHVQGVFQDPFSSFNPVYRADRAFELIHDVYFPGLSHREWHDKIEWALHAVALNPHDVIGKYPHQLSGGQQQRVLIARTLLLDVKLLIADEIISMLDASTRVDILNLLIGLKRAGLAILFITHDLSLGNYVSDRTVILRQGAVVEMGDTVKVFGNPRHPYTRDLLAAVPELHKKWHRPARPASTRDLPPSAAATDLLAYPPASAADPAAGPAADPRARQNSPPPDGPGLLGRGWLSPRRDQSFPGRVHYPPRRRRTESPLALEPPELVECETGHLVAAEER